MSNRNSKFEIKKIQRPFDRFYRFVRDEKYGRVYVMRSKVENPPVSDSISKDRLSKSFHRFQGRDSSNEYRGVKLI